MSYVEGMAELITPKVLKGFRDFLPAQEIPRKNLTEKVEAVFRGFGFLPIDTPALEYTEILLGKAGGETEKQVYRFTDNGGRDVSLRFDLTVPFARFVAEHRDKLSFPFKRYHIAKVWRGENTQKGRYREFTQCDFDIIGADSAGADFEILFIIKNALAACGVCDITIRVNHRGLFNRFLTRIGVEAKLIEILRAVDKLAKTGREEVAKTLFEITGDGHKADEILRFIDFKGDWDATLAMMTRAAGGPNPDSERLEKIRVFMKDTGSDDVFKLDPSITRGLDYYTGIVAETFLNELPAIGSVCSGGRYDNLLSLYTKDPLSGAGASVGLDRLIAALESLGQIEERKTYAGCAIACVDEAKYGEYQALAAKLRAAGLSCEVFDEAKKLTAQFMLAEKRGIQWVIIPPADDTGVFKLRDIATRRDRDIISMQEISIMMKKADDF
jgi:histidyl-tRNA synthetase